MAESPPQDCEEQPKTRADLSAEISRFAAMGALGTLLDDHSTNGNIVWATDVFADRGEGYQPEDEITTPSITGKNIGIVRTRAQKAHDEQTELTRKHAEVFTPTWICKLMIDYADEAWREDNVNADWKDYVSSPRLEITCGEAPYLVNRYDVADGASVSIKDRCGILDRKLHLISEHTRSRNSWIRWALIALKNTYGYEFQGDNLLIARINLLCTLEDFADANGYLPFSKKEYEVFANIISWNLWQMDGLTDCVPLGTTDNKGSELRLPGFDDLFGFVEQQQPTLGIKFDRSTASIFDWNSKSKLEFKTLKKGGSSMRFDYVIGNPPYQEETDGNGRKSPLYNRFMEESYKVADIVELITPGRFLFDAGQTPKQWNRKMLADRHLRVVYYNPAGEDVFHNAEIKGGVAITIRNATADYGPIGFFASIPELNPIIRKVRARIGDSAYLNDVVSSQGLYKFTSRFFAAYPDANNIIGGGTGSKIVSRFIEDYPNAFTKDLNLVSNSYVKLLYKSTSGRDYRYIERCYVQENEFLDTYNVLVPKANGSGAFGEKLSRPEVAKPGEGSADTFISIGMLSTEQEANSLLKYIETKFFRSLLGAKKVTQDNPKAVWSLIPLQDFTSASDIDWSQSIADIDRQLYAKYGLSDDEIAFIENNVKEMA